MSVPIFYYHSVGGPPPQTLDLGRFRQHLEALSRHRVRTLTVADLVRGNYPPQERCAVLAFDDGLLDNYSNVFPLLQERGLRATFYVVPGYDRRTRWVHPGTGRWSDEPRPGYSLAFRSMEAGHRRELSRHGMEIGSHTLSHRSLTRIPRRELEREIRGSKEHLEDELGEPVSTFCYPRGKLSPAVVGEVRRAGYLGACTTVPGYAPAWSGAFLLPRFLVEDPVYFEAVLTGRAFHPRALGRLLWAWLAAKFTDRRGRTG